MKDLLIDYATYHIWANQQLLKIALKLTEEQQNQTIVSSFDSVRKTILHMLDAESIWWQRLQLQEKIIRPSDNNNSSLKEIVQQMDVQSKVWLEKIKGMKENQLQFVFAYQNTKREMFKQPVWQMLLHLYNHANFHRGQLVTLYRQLGITKIPATDFILWSRK